MAGRFRSGLPLLSRALRSSSQGSGVHRAVLSPALTTSEASRNYASAAAAKEDVKLPLVLHGGTGNYASALFLAAKKANVLEKVESEVLGLAEAMKGSPTFTQFAEDLSVPTEIRTKAIAEICGEAKFSDITKNFLAVLAQSARLKYLEGIAKKFSELTMADRGEVKVVVTSVIPLPPQEEKELNETLLELLGEGKKVKLEQRIDPTILGGLIVEFDLKVFDMSIKTRAMQMERFIRESVTVDLI